MRQLKKQEVPVRRLLAVVLAAVFLASTLAYGQVPAAPASRTLYTTAALVLHATPSATGTRVTSLPVGTKLTIGKCVSGWCQVLDAGKHGYVAERYLSATAPTIAARVLAS